MPQYYVEGLYASKQGVRKKLKTGTYPAKFIEPFAKPIWANSPKEAIQIATADLAGGEWTEGPSVSLVTEEQRMRSMGAPEFPDLEIQPAKRQQKDQSKPR